MSVIRETTRICQDTLKEFAGKAVYPGTRRHEVKEKINSFPKIPQSQKRNSIVSQ